MEDGKFCRLGLKAGENIDLDSVVSPQTQLMNISQGENESLLQESGFDHIYSVATSVNNSLIVISGKLKSFNPKVMTKILVHPNFILNSTCSASTFRFLSNCVRKLRMKKGNFNDLIFAMKSQNVFVFVLKYLEKLLYKEKNRNNDTQREEILLQFCQELQVNKMDLKMLLFGLYSNMVYLERQQKLIDIGTDVTRFVEDIAIPDFNFNNEGVSVKLEESGDEDHENETSSGIVFPKDEFGLHQISKDKGSRDEKRFALLKEKMIQKFWIRKISRETFELLPGNKNT
jgi:hypothetical protein